MTLRFGADGQPGGGRTSIFAPTQLRAVTGCCSHRNMDPADCAARRNREAHCWHTSRVLEARTARHGNRMDRVLAVHGPKDQQTISRLADVSGSLRAEMEMHIAALDILASLCPHDLAPLAIQRRQ